MGNTKIKLPRTDTELQISTLDEQPLDLKAIQNQHLIDLKKSLEPFNIKLNPYWYGEFKYTKGRGNGRMAQNFLIKSECGKILWRKYEASDSASGTQTLYILDNETNKAEKIKLTDWLEFSTQQRSDILKMQPQIAQITQMQEAQKIQTQVAEIQPKIEKTNFILPNELIEMIFEYTSQNKIILLNKYYYNLFIKKYRTKYFRIWLEENMCGAILEYFLKIIDKNIKLDKKQLKKDLNISDKEIKEYKNMLENMFNENVSELCSGSYNYDNYKLPIIISNDLFNTIDDLELSNLDYTKLKCNAVKRMIKILSTFNIKSYSEIELPFKIIYLRNKFGINFDCRGTKVYDKYLKFNEQISIYNNNYITIQDLIDRYLWMKSHKFDRWYELFTGIKYKNKYGNNLIELCYDHGS